MATVQIIGLDKVYKRLADVDARTKKPRSFQEQAGGLMLADVQNTFAVEGPGWAPLDPQYARQPRKGGILFKTGALYRSIKLRFGTDFVDVFTDKFYGFFHQFGEAGLAQRVFMNKLTAEAKALILQIAQKEFGWK